MCDDVTQSCVRTHNLLRRLPLSCVRDTHSAVSSVSSDYQQVLLLWPGDNAAMQGLLAQGDTAISSALADEFSV